MMRLFSFLIAAVLALAACTPVDTVRLGPDGRPVQEVYRVSDADADRIRGRMQNAVNALRENRGAPALQLEASLNRAAQRHSRDMSRQSRPWHFGSDGSTPPGRAADAGYRGRVVGEAVSETFESELQTLTAWMQESATREVITDRQAREMGFGFYQDPDGRLWWTLLLGDPTESGRVPGRRAGS